MRTSILQALVLAFLVLPLVSHAKPVTYDFEAVDESSSGNGLPPQWDIRGSIVVDDEIDAVFDDPYIRLGNSIVDGSLSINGVSAGNFNSGAFSYLFMDGLEDPEPYSADMNISFDAGENFGPVYWSLYTEEFNRAGPALADDFTDLGAFLEGFDVGSYAEMVVGVNPLNDASPYHVRLDLISKFVPREQASEVPEPALVPMLLLGLAASFWRRHRHS